jgi:flagellar motor switch protein FliM
MEQERVMAETELVKVESTESVDRWPIKAILQPQIDRIEEHASWPVLSQMTVVTTAGIPLRGFRVGDLLRLEPGQIVESEWSHTEDVPLKAGRVQVAWSEFEVADQHLVVRLTRLA